jgi:hypothetical protein
MKFFNWPRTRRNEISMKIGKRVIQTRKINVNTKHTFDANYKGLHIYVSDDHGHGIAKGKGLTRYWMQVRIPPSLQPKGRR